MENYIGTGIISNTHVCEVSRLFNPTNGYEFREAYRGVFNPATCSYDHYDFIENKHSIGAARNNLRVFDLLTLIDSIVLNDKLYTLPLTIEAQKDPLWKDLLRLNIIETLDTSQFNINIGQAISNQLENLKTNPNADKDLIIALSKYGFNRVSRLVETFFDMDIQRELDFPQYKSPRHFITQPYYSDFSDSHAFDSLLHMIDGPYQPVEESGVISILRTMYYIYTSEYLKIPYYPQSTRIKFAEDYPNFYDITFKTQLYDKLAQSLSASVSDVYEDFSDEATFVPPFSALVLDRSTNPGEIIKRALELRDEFASVREGFNQLEEERIGCENLQARIKLKKRQKQLLEDAAKAYKGESLINLSSTIKYIPEVIKPVMAYADPTKYGANLLLQPFDILMEWWRKRPIRKMYTMENQVVKIKEYHNLIQKHFPDANMSNLKWNLRKIEE